MKTVVETVDELVIQSFIKKIKNGEISEYTKKLFEKASESYPEIKKIGIVNCAAFTSNWNAGKCSLGQKAQLQVLKKDFPSIKALPSRGKNCVRLGQDLNSVNLSLIIGSDKTLPGIKSLDAQSQEDNKIQFFMLKTTDIGSFSDSKGGGHQGNVFSELELFCKTVLNNNIQYKGKDVEFYVIISGRLAEEFSTKLNSDFKSSNLHIKYYE